MNTPKARNPREWLVVDDGYWMHIRVTRVYHRHCPEIRGEGHTLGEASDHLAGQLSCALNHAHGRGERVAIERALADVLALRPAATRAHATSPS